MNPKGHCLLGARRPKVCKDFPKRQSDIDSCGSELGERSTCVAAIGGDDCNHCGQCCRNDPWPKKGCPETNFETWVDENNVCIHYIP